MAKPPRPPKAKLRKTDAAPADQVVSASLVAKPADPRQAGLFDLPLPGWMRPCLPTLVDKPPSGPQWVHEIKWDGYRVSVYVEAGKVTIRTRNGHDWIQRLQPLREQRPPNLPLQDEFLLTGIPSAHDLVYRAVMSTKICPHLER